MKFQFAIDRGGTFTDIYARCPSGKVTVMKLLSVDSAYPDAPREGIRRIIQEETGTPIARNQLIDGSLIDWIRMGTTVATNALLERKGERMALLITKGFRDLLYIGNQARPKIFDLGITMPENLYEEVLEIDERVITDRADCEMESSKSWRKEVSSTNENLLVAVDIDLEKVREDLERIKAKGIKSLAIVLLHSYMFSRHEKQLGELALELGFSHVSLSSEVMPMIRAVPRGFTASADAYLTPLIKKYVEGFQAGFRDLPESSVLFMKSDGGLTPMEEFYGSRAILSGPAGGVVGYARTCFNDSKVPVIGFDMGGTSTDVSRFDGSFEHTYESTTAGVTIQAPQLDISTVAAGGGSQLFFRSGMFVVGPESAGASPGPVCYRKGGTIPAVTDANLCLGRLLPEFFPKIFGPEENAPLDKDATVQTFNKITERVNVFLTSQGSPAISTEEIAMGFIRVANEAMCRPIRAITQGKGYDTSSHILACFGGAGGQHACAVAKSLGIKTVVVPRYAGILSAFGLALADVIHEKQEPACKELNKDNIEYIDARIDSLVAQGRQHLLDQKFDTVETEIFLHLRYNGTDCALMCKPLPYEDGSTDKLSRHGDFIRNFIQRYQSEFGFTIPGRVIIVDDIRVRAIGKSGISEESLLTVSQSPPEPVMSSKIYFERLGWSDCPVYIFENLHATNVIKGPAIIMDKLSTILVEPDCVAEITQQGDIRITVGSSAKVNIGTALDTIQLSIFSHRFMSIAEQMGRILQRTAISTNIKERLDFSCAVFGPDGGLVSNAPHIPVHLGAMQEAVQFQIKSLQGEMFPGDVILSNHPCAGGSHLPDLTVITPVFRPGDSNPIFFVASRGHHADIGGITPGSMPPHSKALWEEGACFKSFKLVSNGQFKEKELKEELMKPGQYPGSSGTRNFEDNRSDLQAAVAANQKGINLILDLIEVYGLEVVQAYMNHIQTNAEIAVRQMLREFGQKLGKNTLFAADYMDDGTKIQLTVEIDTVLGNAVFDFSGTGYEVWGNCNAPRAITVSAIIYCLRCLVGQDIPLNQGCLTPIRTVIPEGSILSPSDDAAVVGGNVLTSQRVVDVILKAFEACAASQGCMNNLTFGDERMGYYETIAGGAGAGPGWNGRSGIHTHMTNTRITDPEILEIRYPVILNHFSLEHGTGGRGKYVGGDGVRRELTFRKNITVSVLTERRVFHPYGMHGGSPGSVGKNLLKRKLGNKLLNLGGKTTVNVKPEDMLCLLTPGGGGYGSI
ncbi:unnamed protein product [Allacma fusca]|uniref:5-oxoprolinase n=1 Tax=Allacma fusca TaxID=39272 RepID=A0A8J2L0P3_9HEXA|nr:unnamed protein product [Allacma fusca]